LPTGGRGGGFRFFRALEKGTGRPHPEKKIQPSRLDGREKHFFGAKKGCLRPTTHLPRRRGDMLRPKKKNTASKKDSMQMFFGAAVSRDPPGAGHMQTNILGSPRFFTLAGFGGFQPHRIRGGRGRVQFSSKNRQGPARDSGPEQKERHFRGGPGSAHVGNAGGSNFRRFREKTRGAKSGISVGRGARNLLGGVGSRYGPRLGPTGPGEIPARPHGL